MSAIAQIVEMDTERDRKTCIALDLKVSGANRELAQWLLDHPRYSNRGVAGWLGCNHTRIVRLRKWARNGFVGLPFDQHNQPDYRTRHDHGGAAQHQSPLESLDNFEVDDQPADSEHVAPPVEVEDNILHIIQRQGAGAMAVKKILKVSSLDREAKARISEAIDRLIAKWRSTQATLAPRKDSKC